MVIITKRKFTTETTETPELLQILEYALGEQQNLIAYPSMMSSNGDLADFKLAIQFELERYL